MTRFIMLSFVFLGWAFYETSGGADFKPEPPLRLARYEAEKKTVPQPATPAPKEAGAASPVQLASLDPVSDAPVSRVSPAPPRPQFRTESVTSAPASIPGARFPVLNRAFPPDGAPSLRTAGLVDGAAAAESSEESPFSLAALAIPKPERDIRTVSASRLNMRNGPGTTFSVLETLSRGDQVVILQDPGAGWVKIRPQESQRIGWVSARLLKRSSQ